MYKTKLEPFRKVIIAIVIVMAAFTSICAAAFIPVSDTQRPAQKRTGIEPCATSLVSQTPVPTASEAPCVIFVSDELEEIKDDPNPYADLVLTQAEKELLARMVYNEARGEPFEGQIAVVQVALNRYMHKAFHGSISDILLAPHQFSVGSTYGETQMKAVEAALAGEPVLELNTEVVFFSAGSPTYGSYYKTIGGHNFRTYS